MLYSALRTSARGLASFALSVCLASIAWGADSPSSPSSLWAVRGKTNTVYLLGSLHLLRANETLPASMEAAYRDAEHLVMEIDLDDLEPAAVQQTMSQHGMLPAGSTLAQQLGPELYAQFEAETVRLGMPSTLLQPLQPWLASIMLTQFQLMKLGFAPNSGVEMRFVTRARADGKEVRGLETLDEQIKLLATLSPDLQKQLLAQTLKQAAESETEVESMLSAWRTGDATTLASYVERGLKEFPELYHPLTVERNRRWLARVEELLSAQDDYLVIVGALHLVGKDGVVDLLKAKGYTVEQH